MYTVKFIAVIGLWAIAGAACGSTPNDSGPTTTEADTTAATTTGTTTDDPELSTSTGQPTSTGTSTGHDSHTSADSTGDPHMTTDDPQNPVEEYCGCMLVQCHDEFHARWGDEHRESIALCEAEAEAAGAGIECRISYCTEAAGDVEACASALGEGACADAVAR